MVGRQKTIVIGAGPAGALAALYAAQRDHDVEIYELRSDLRDPSTTPLNFTKSINLAFSERGINAIRHSGPREQSFENTSLLSKVLDETIPMRARMIHGKNAGGLYEESQNYDVHGRTLFAVDRGGLNKALLDELATMSNVKFFFNHKMVGADFKNHKAWFSKSKSDEIEVAFDLLIGADGAHSAARYHLMKYTRMDYQQEYIDTLWCEFTIAAKSYPENDPDAKFAISPNHLHIWPGQEFMFIAIPSIDGSFTCTLFLPTSHFATLESDPAQVPSFFDNHFPGVTSLIHPKELIKSFTQNPHLPLISIKCAPHHFSDSGVILGDAAHAMVPFYGQGMNAGLEDVRFLFSLLDKYDITALPPREGVQKRARALQEYSDARTKDAHAINDLALDNYKEMRASVTNPVYKMRKWLEERIDVYIPSLGWATKYSRVSFGNEPYSEVIRKTERQSLILVRGLIGAALAPVALGAIVALLKYRQRPAGNALLSWIRNLYQ